MLIWNPATTDAFVHGMLTTLSEEYPLQAGTEAVNLAFQKEEAPDVLRVTLEDGVWHVAYGRDSLAARGVAYALSGQTCDEKSPFVTHGILFDCTRGNVITVSYFKHWLRRLALLGYNMAMIYVKDAYQIQDEPYFGYMRGAYSLEEMREVDAYARGLGIEMIASIQALGHLEPVLRWPAFDAVKDTANVIMVDEPRSYQLLEKMLRFWSEALSSRRIHLGMDETHDLGRGRFMDRHGYENPFNLYNRHLRKVCDLCDTLALKPIIWSDMYFRFANARQDYYDTEATVPDEVRSMIPQQVQLSYWDYYHRDSHIYETMLKKTQALNGSAPFMASGIWTWGRFWTDFEMTFATVRPCVDACRKTGAKELIYTLWGDDGGYCEFDSAFAGLAWAADYAYNDTDCDTRISRLYQAVCGTSYELQKACGNLCYTFTRKDGQVHKVNAASLLWDDPIMGIVWHEYPAIRENLPEELLQQYRVIMEKVGGHRNDKRAGMYEYAWQLARVLTMKIKLREKLEEAYRRQQHQALVDLREQDIPAMLEALDDLLAIFREQWLRSFKTYGLELMQIRLGGLKERYRELDRILGELLEGKRIRIPELELVHKPKGAIQETYLRCATGCFFI